MGTWMTIRGEGETSAEMRASLMERFVVPMAQHALTEDLRLEQVVFSVAQYFADNAYDQVHLDFFGRIVARPGTVAYELELERTRSTGRATIRMCHPRWIRTPGDPVLPLRTFGESLWHKDYCRGRTDPDDPNHIDGIECVGHHAVLAFASHCTGGRPEDEDDAFSPYAVISRKPEMFGEEATLVAIDDFLSHHAIMPGKYGNWGCMARGRECICAGPVPMSVRVRLAVVHGWRCIPDPGVVCPVDVEIVGKVLRPEWERSDASWRHPMGVDEDWSMRGAPDDDHEINESEED